MVDICCCSYLPTSLFGFVVVAIAVAIEPSMPNPSSVPYPSRMRG